MALGRWHEAWLPLSPSQCTNLYNCELACKSLHHCLNYYNTLENAASWAFLFELTVIARLVYEEMPYVFRQFSITCRPSRQGGGGRASTIAVASVRSQEPTQSKCHRPQTATWRYFNKDMSYFRKFYALIICQGIFFCQTRHSVIETSPCWHRHGAYTC